MTSRQGADLTWREQVLVAMDRRGTSTRRVVADAKARGLKISVGTMAEAMTGKVPPNDRVVAAYSIVLGIHPDDLGFERSPLTELGYLAFEAVHGQGGDGGRRAKAA
jgi:lambda repressor-like predicted transcriptional regulator